MHLRRDALAAAAEWITFVEKQAVESKARHTDGLVATIGRITAEPNATNVIPGTIHASLDLRHASDPIRTAAVDALIAEARAIAHRRGLSVEFTQTMNEPAVPMDPYLTTQLSLALGSEGFPAKTMTSGAGHDAMVLAAHVPTAMLFLRSPGGISHHPAESVRAGDVEAALRVAANFLERISATINKI
jgi:allantoate deiminase